MEEIDKFKELTLEQLQKRRKWFKFIVITLGTVTVLSIITFCYDRFVKKNYFSSTSLGAIALPLILSSIYLQKLETEIKSRNSQS